MCSFCDDGAVSRVEMDTRKVSEEEGRVGHVIFSFYCIMLKVCVSVYAWEINSPLKLNQAISDSIQYR